MLASLFLAALAASPATTLPETTTPSGGKVRFLGVFNSFSGTVWDASGRRGGKWVRLPSDPQFPPLREEKGKFDPTFSGVRELRFLCRLGPGMHLQPSAKVHPLFQSMSTSATSIGDDRWVLTFGLNLDKPKDLPKTVSFRIGIADGPWKVIGTKTLTGSKSYTGLNFHPLVVPPAKHEALYMKGQSNIEIELPPKFKDCAVDVIPYDREGHRLRPGSSSRSLPSGVLSTVSFVGKPSDVAKIEIRARYFKWIPMRVRLSK